jgi:hypothetical protein
VEPPVTKSATMEPQIKLASVIVFAALAAATAYWIFQAF